MHIINYEYMLLNSNFLSNNPDIYSGILFHGPRRYSYGKTSNTVKKKEMEAKKIK